MSGTLEESFLFDNPVVGREIRIGLRPGVIAIFATAYALLLLVTLWGTYHLYRSVVMTVGGETLAFGSLAFLLLMGVQVFICTLVVPFRACGFLDRERKDRSLDQFLVSGYSPYSALLGKLGISFAVTLIIISIGIPFALLCYSAGGVSLGTILRSYAVLVAYCLFLLSFAIALSTQVPDLAAALLTGPGVIGVLFLAHLGSTPPALTALSPVQHILWDFQEAFSRLGYDIQQTVFFEWPVEPWVLSIFYFLSLSLLSAFVAVMGPEIPIITGLHVYGESRAADGRKRKKTRSLLARSSEVAFFYENRPGWLRRNDVLVREVVIGVFLTLLVVTLMGTLWPPGLAPFDAATFLYPFCIFTFILLPLLALTGLRGQRAFARTVRVGRRVVSAVVVSRLAFLIKALIPLGCAVVAVSISSRTHVGDGFERYLWSYAVIFAFSLLLFSIFLSISIRTRSPGRALALGFLVGLGLAVLPHFWFYGYGRFWWGAETHPIAELSPVIAVQGALEPDHAISISRLPEGDGFGRRGWESSEFYPDPLVFLLVYLPLGVALLTVGDRWIRKRLRALGATGAVILLLVGAAVEALGQELVGKEIVLEAEVGLDGVLTGPWVPVTIKVRNLGPDLDGTLRIRLEGAQQGSFAYRITVPRNGEKRVQKVFRGPLPGRVWWGGPGGGFGFAGVSSIEEVTVAVEEGGRIRAETEPLEPGTSASWSRSLGLQRFRGWGYPGGVPPAVVALDRRGRLPLPKEEGGLENYFTGDRPQVFYPEVWALPDFPLGYDGVDAVVLGDLPLERLSPDQRRALRVWVERGGTLILSPTRLAGSWRGSFVEGITGLPGLALDRERDVSRLALRHRSRFQGDPIVLTGDLTPLGGKILLAGSEGPLAIELPAGRGRLVVTAFDLWAPPIPGWKGTGRLIRDLAGERSPAPSGEMWNLIGPLLYSSEGGLGPALAFCLLFLLAVGPGAYIFLRWRRMPRAIWIAIPAVSLCFGGIAVLVSPLDRGEPSHCRDALALDLYPGAEHGTAARFLAYSSTGRESHSLSLRGEEPSLEMWDVGPWGLVPRRLEASEAGARQVTVDPMRIHRWGNRLVRGKGPFRIDGLVTARVEKGRGWLKISVTNESSLDLREAFLRIRYFRNFERDGYVTLGDLPPGGAYEKEIPLDGKEGEWIKERLFPSAALSEETVRFLSPDVGGFAGEILVARLALETGDRFITPVFDAHTLPQERFAFLTVPVEVPGTARGRFFHWSIPSRAVPVDVDRELAAVTAAPGPGNTWRLGVQWEYRAPSLGSEPSLERMVVRLPATATTTPQPYEIYDWVREEWVPLADLGPTAQGDPIPPTEVWISPKDPSRYLLSPEGVILVRNFYASGQSYWDLSAGPKVILEGAVPE